MFYTDVSRLGNDILFSGYDGNKKVNKRIQFAPSLYERGQGEFECFDGGRAREIKFSTIKEANEFIQSYSGSSNHSIYGMQNWIFQWVAKNFPLEIEFDPSLIKTIIFDIEVDPEGKGFPDPNKAEMPVTAISFHISTVPDRYFEISTVDYDVSKRTVLLDKEVEYIKVQNETEVLRTFLSIWQSENFDIISGWNVQYFDIPYLVHRIERVLGNGLSSRLSPWGKVLAKERTLNNEVRKIYTIVGIQTLDYIDVFKKFGVALETPENYQLNTVAEMIIGEGKVEYSEEEESITNLYRANPQKFIDYSLKDSYLIVEMEKKLQFLQIAIMIAYKTGANYIDTLGTTAVWDSFIHRVLLSEKTVIPPRRDEDGGWFEGAYVKPPQVGIHRWITSFDFASLYPNIIIQLNISPETIVKNERDMACKPADFLADPTLKNPKPHYSMAANGVYFKKDKQGVIPRLTEATYNERVIVKGKMLELQKMAEKETDPDKKEELQFSITALKNKENSLKVLINSLYGAFGSKYFRYFSLPAAEAVTLTGQLAFHLTLSAVNKKLSKMMGYSDEIVDYGITGDTDSVYFTMDEFVDRFAPEDPFTFVEKISEEIIDPTIKKEMTRMNSEVLFGFKERLVMKREVIGSGFFVAKKHYALLIHGAEGGIRFSTPKLKIKGIAAIKSSTPKAIRSKMKDLFMLILTGASHDQIFGFVDEVKGIFYSLPAEKIAFPRGVNDIEKWEVPSATGFEFSKGTPIQVKSAMLYNFLIKDRGLANTLPRIHSGDKIKFVYLKVPNPVRSEVIGFLNRLPGEFGLSQYIDYQKMFEKTFLDTVDPIFEKIGLGKYKGSSASDLFSFFS